MCLYDLIQSNQDTYILPFTNDFATLWYIHDKDTQLIFKLDDAYLHHVIPNHMIMTKGNHYVIILLSYKLNKSTYMHHVNLVIL